MTGQSPMAQSTRDGSRPTEKELFASARALRKEGKPQAAVESLRQAMRRGWFSPEAFEKIGRLVAEYVDESSAPGLRILVLGQFTTTWISHGLVACAWCAGQVVRATNGQFDNVLQELMAASASGERYDAVVLLPWNERLLSAKAEDGRSRVAAELDFWRQAWNIVTNRMATRLVQVGYDWVYGGPDGQHMSGRRGGAVQVVRSMNDQLREALPESAYFVDLDQSAGLMGRERFYDPRRYAWTKQPFSEGGAVALAGQIWAGIRALINGPKKVLVLDLDNTLWGGVVGETGPMGIECGDGTAGESFKAFQTYVKALSRRGVLLAVSSKNNLADAREPFEKNSALPLKLEDFAAFEANWEPKSLAISRIADTLRLGLDSFVFFDDNPAEREHVRQMLPEVEVVEVPEEPAQYIRALEAGQWFEAVGVTAEDKERTEQYRVEAQRRELQGNFASMEEYLRSLDMHGDVQPVNEADIGRVVQLLGKTNQFNLTTRRHGLETLRAMLAEEGSISMTVRIADRFADYGLIAVLLGTRDPRSTVRTLRIDTWLMSCRVIARTVEEFCLGCLIEEARRQGYARLVGEYIVTKKNALVADLYSRLGFTPIDGPGESVHYELDLLTCAPAVTFVMLKE